MDLGLDVEAYKEYVNNTQEFAKFNKDWEVFCRDDLQVPPGLFVGGPSQAKYM